MNQTIPHSASRCISCGEFVAAINDWMKKYYASQNGIQLSDVSEDIGDWGKIIFQSPTKAFLFHTCCWSLLIKQFENEAIDLRRLFEVCRDRPCSEKDYKFSNAPNGFIMRDARWKPLWFGGSGGPWYPLKKPRTRYTGNATRELKSIQRSKTLYCNLSSSNIDCISALPIEIRLEIASYLLTADFFTLRAVSRGMAAIFSLQSFWKTRFHINGDRGFLCYLTEGPQGHQKKNWRSIYHCTARCDTSDSLLLRA
ncbi:unnamed protein product [Penicillium salamii]|uniref:F-box domain-containing protein n=1 Tax=Penicillium salamii TaxID=1612424 RepID=A0A9W4JHD4_9EURO|nr:unnamed protein product [Penicillium salamii]